MSGSAEDALPTGCRASFRKAAASGGPDVAFFRAALVALAGHVREDLLVARQDVEEAAVVLDVLRRERAAADHQLPEERGVVGAQSRKDLDQGVPGRSTPRDDAEPAELEAVLERRFRERELLGQVRQHFVEERCIPSLDGVPLRVEDEQVSAEGGRHQVEVHLGDLAGSELGAGLHEHLQPEAEAVRVELVRRAGSRGLPEVVIEDAHQLLGGGERDDRSGVLETALLDELMQNRGLQALHHPGEIGRLEDPTDQIARGSRRQVSLGHGTSPHKIGSGAVPVKPYLLRCYELFFLGLPWAEVVEYSWVEEDVGLPAARRLSSSSSPSGERYPEAGGRSEDMIRKLSSGGYRLYSRKKDPKTGRRRNLGTFKTRAAALRHERAVQYFKRAG